MPKPSHSRTSRLTAAGTPTFVAAVKTRAAASGVSISTVCRFQNGALWLAEFAVILAWGYALLVWFPLLVGGAS